jgi:hypothetical protein
VDSALGRLASQTSPIECSLAVKVEEVGNDAQGLNMPAYVACWWLVQVVGARVNTRAADTTN